MSITDKDINSVMGIVRREAARWQVPGLDRDDLESEGLLAALQALKTLDPEKGSKEAWVGKHIRQRFGALKRPAQSRDIWSADTDQVEETSTAPAPAQALDLTLIRKAWQYFTFPEKRSVLAMISGSRYADIGQIDGVSKQAVHKGIYSARRIMATVASGETPSRKPRPHPIDTHFEILISSRS
jgi:DNA-directed RNA polymerase specialized sigma24 family protein